MLLFYMHAHKKERNFSSNQVITKWIVHAMLWTSGTPRTFLWQWPPLLAQSLPRTWRKQNVSVSPQSLYASHTNSPVSSGKTSGMIRRCVLPSDFILNTGSSKLISLSLWTQTISIGGVPGRNMLHAHAMKTMLCKSLSRCKFLTIRTMLQMSLKKWVSIAMQTKPSQKWLIN